MRNNPATLAAYRAAHKDKIAAYQVAYREEHGEEMKSYQAAYHAEHREARNARVRERGGKYRQELKMAALNAYGGPRCACCGETLVAGLSIDHINGGGMEHLGQIGNRGMLYPWLKKNNYPPGFQVLCMTCNKAKGTGDHCPHQDAWL